jgi:hypothetical protein
VVDAHTTENCYKAHPEKMPPGMKTPSRTFNATIVPAQYA